MASIKCGNCKASHGSAAEVRACYGAQQQARKTADPFGSAPQALQVTEKQASFIATLRKQRGLDPLAFTGTRKQASDEIERLKAMPKVQTQPKDEPADGIYVDDNAEVYKVYKMVHGSGRQGVKVLEQGRNSGSFRYLGLAVKHLPASTRVMTLEQAKEFGRLYGFCVKCGRTLTDEGSIANGIGPICAGKGGWA